MKLTNILLLPFIISVSIITAQKDFITVHNNPQEDVMIVIDAKVYFDYGFVFPLAYEFSIVDNSHDLQTFKRNKISNQWELLEVKYTSMFLTRMKL